VRFHPAARRAAAAIGLLAALLAGCSSSAVVVSELVPPTVAAEVLSERSSEIVLLDVRTPDEFAGGRIAGAINIDYYGPSFADQLGQLDKTVPYVVYCRSGNRSEDAVEVMRNLGFREVYEISGGIVSWSEAGLPLGP